MSTNWFRALNGGPATSDKYLVCLKGIYYLAHYDSKKEIFQIESDGVFVQIARTDPDLYWATLQVSSSEFTVLVIDDDPDDLENMISTVRHINPAIKVEKANNGNQAIHYLSVNNPERVYPAVILLDLFMPDTDGFSVLQSVRSMPELEHTKIYVFSSSFSKEDWKKAQDLGATAVFHKNYATVELARIFTDHSIENPIIRKRNFI